MIHRKTFAKTGSPIAAVSILLAGIFTANAQTEPTVRVSGGEIRGHALASGATFKGIPYAAPPVGDLRWREPASVQPWNGVRDAGAYGAVCAQIGGTRNPAATKGVEDCLFLNLWTPEWPAKSRLPVMVFFHGGGNMRGSSLGAAGIEPPFDGESLSHHGVVLVTVNYRLGVLGFFARPDLAAESSHHASGNYGLMDEIASLQWVKENVAKFGGDPANVTIFGQSAGANDTGQLLASPLAKGLFQHAIEESGTVVGSGKLTMSRSEAEQIGRDIAAKMKAPAGTGALAYMRGLPVADILKASPAYGTGLTVPIVDGYVITKTSALVFQSGQQNRADLMVGNNAREMPFDGTPEALQKALADFYGSLAPRALKLYAQASTYPPYGDLGNQFITDTGHRCPAITIADWHSAAGLSAYEYEFSHAFPESKIGASHSGELRYVFGVFPAQPAETEHKISEDMETYWTNFAKTGNPNGKGLPVWPKFDSTARRYIEFTDNEPVAKEDLRHDFCQLFDENLKARMAQLESPRPH
jgi:para-nitrobenzyl esterase